MTFDNTLVELRQTYQNRVEQQLNARTQRTSLPTSLMEAMRYSVLLGGKRVRPLLVYLVNQLLGGKLSHADSAACAIEAIHCYSLIHDDLPAMDNDDLRRGKPTCHIAFDHATAILAGDALQPMAFEWLAKDELLHPETRIQMVTTLALAAGDQGMVSGQAFDLAHVGKPLTIDELEAMHRYKTGALLSASIQLGALSSEQPLTAEQQQALRIYGDAIGLAFQVKDDLLDIEGDSAEIGKPQGSDQAANKPTYPALLGLDGARQKLNQLHQEAVEAISLFGDAAKPLKQLSDFIVHRSH